MQESWQELAPLDKCFTRHWNFRTVVSKVTLPRRQILGPEMMFAKQLSKTQAGQDRTGQQQKYNVTKPCKCNISRPSREVPWIGIPQNSFTTGSRVSERVDGRIDETIQMSSRAKCARCLSNPSFLLECSVIPIKIWISSLDLNPY